VIPIPHIRSIHRRQLQRAEELSWQVMTDDDDDDQTPYTRDPCTLRPEPDALHPTPRHDIPHCDFA
jgi:hypothetical protein